MGLLIKLQNGDTALKSLKFGNDRPGGGDSGQPYIKDPILDNPLPESKDFLLRGGLNAPIDAAQDVIRLTKYMFDPKSPSGLLFTAKQNLLSRTAPKTEASKGIGYAGGALNEGVYTPLSTLAQAGVGFLGIHLNKQGIDPTGLIPGLSINKYEKVVYNNNKEENNIVLGYSSKGTIVNAVFENRLLDIWYSKQQKTTESNDVLSYGGGPNSILGVGKTHIEFAKDGNNAPLRTGINNSQASSNPQSFYKGGLTRPKTEVDYYTTLGASYNKDFTLTGTQIGLNLEGKLERRYYGPEDNNKTIGKYNPTSNPLTGSEGYQIGLPRPETEVNYNNLLGASKKQGLNNLETSIKEDGHFDTSSPFTSKFNPEVPYSTLSKDTKGLTLSGSEGYQIGKQNHFTEESDTTYKSQIQGKLAELGRELLSDSQFNKTSGTWGVTSGGKFILPYTSSPSLKIDPKADEKGQTLDDVEIAKRLNASTNEGYLANLNKNGGTGTDGVPFKHNNYRVGGYGISNDFRQVNRKKRGFKDTKSTYDYIAPVDPITGKKKQYIDYEKETTIDNIYYNSGESKRTSNSLDDDFKDLIEFKIGIVNPESPTDVNYTRFRAYIDNFSDSYGSDWSKQTYMGRGEKFFKYNSFDRSISLGFTIVADNYTNLQTMYNQLNKLAASLAPTYTNQGYLAGNLHKLTVGDYVIDQYGILEGMTYEVTEESPWEITAGSQLPMYIRVTGIKFTPIHNFRPEMNWTPNDEKVLEQHRFIHQTKETNSTN
jgi:hypothetical protein